MTTAKVIAKLVTAGHEDLAEQLVEVVTANLRKRADDRFDKRFKEYLKKYKGELTERDEWNVYAFPDQGKAKAFERDMKALNKKSGTSIMRALYCYIHFS